MEILYENLLNFTWQNGVMILIGCLLIFLAIKKEMEPTLLLPMGFGTILVNIPGADVVKGEITELLVGGFPIEYLGESGALTTLYHAGIANELFPLLLFIGIGAITVAAYSYMALVPIIQPPVIKLLTTKKERKIRMPYEQKNVSKLTRIMFPIVITIVAAAVVPQATSLINNIFSKKN